MTEIEGKSIQYSEYLELEFKFRKNSKDITSTKDMHLPLGKSTFKGQNIWVVGLRSTKYFHMTKDSILRYLRERIIFSQ